jgi:hypothetical protein
MLILLSFITYAVCGQCGDFILRTGARTEFHGVSFRNDADRQALRHRMGFDAILFPADAATLVSPASISPDPATKVCELAAQNCLRQTSATLAGSASRRLAVRRMAANLQGMMRFNTDNTVAIVRSAILAVLVIALVGTGLELLLLGHFEALSQLIPISLIALALGVLIVYTIRRAPLILRLFQIVMVLFVVAGVTGIALHYQSNVEFELELYPTIQGMELLAKVLTGAIPVLAPGTMIHLGLLGCIYTFRHPLLVRRKKYDNSATVKTGG